MVKTDKKVVKKPAVKKTTKKATAKKVVVKKTTKKVVAKKRKIKGNTEDYLAKGYMVDFLSGMMPDMIKQLDNGVDFRRMMEMLSIAKGQIDLAKKTASFKYDKKAYACKQVGDFWKVV